MHAAVLRRGKQQQKPLPIRFDALTLHKVHPRTIECVTVKYHPQGHAAGTLHISTYHTYVLLSHSRADSERAWGARIQKPKFENNMNRHDVAHKQEWRHHVSHLDEPTVVRIACATDASSSTIKGSPMWLVSIPMHSLTAPVSEPRRVRRRSRACCCARR